MATPSFAALLVWSPDAVDLLPKSSSHNIPHHITTMALLDVAASQEMPLEAKEGMAYPELAQRISKACGALHQSLNIRIMSSLPLALPPKAKDTRLFAAGLASFGMIYLTFEEMWQEVTSTRQSKSAHERQIIDFLDSLRPRGLERSPRLRQDLRYLRSADDDDIFSRLQTEGPAEKAFRRHIQTSAELKPHTLYAYAWCMYMAVFAGGRYVREDLADAGEKFWRKHGYSKNPGEEANKPADMDRLGYSFLSFDADDDGLEIERIFRHNLLEAEDLLDEDEKKDVVTESQAIFNLTIDLVAELQQSIRPDDDAESSGPPPAYSPPPYSAATRYDRMERLSGESNSLLRMEADEDELLAWREQPIKRSLWFRIRLVVLALIAGTMGSLTIYAVRWLVPTYLGDERDITGMQQSWS